MDLLQLVDLDFHIRGNFHPSLTVNGPKQCFKGRESQKK